MDKQEELKAEAIRLGLCEKWQSEWGTPDDLELIQKYIDGIDFCIQHDYPSNEYIKMNFDKRLLHACGIYVDDYVAAYNPPVAVLNGKCHGEVVIDGIYCRDVYVRGTSYVTVAVRDTARASIRVYDKAHVNVIAEPKTKVYVYLYGGVAEGDNIIVRNKKTV
jgi:hypothetical protein